MFFTSKSRLLVPSNYTFELCLNASCLSNRESTFLFKPWNQNNNTVEFKYIFIHSNFPSHVFFLLGCAYFLKFTGSPVLFARSLLVKKEDCLKQIRTANVRKIWCIPHPRVELSPLGRKEKIISCTEFFPFCQLRHPYSLSNEFFRRLQSRKRQISWLSWVISGEKPSLSTDAHHFANLFNISVSNCQCFAFLFFKSAFFSDIWKIRKIIMIRKNNNDMQTITILQKFSAEKDNGYFLGDTSDWK